MTKLFLPAILVLALQSSCEQPAFLQSNDQVVGDLNATNEKMAVKK